MARDLDSIRAALGEEKASYLGYSYGSALGAAYASMFPETADRVVLDSNVGDTHLDQEGLRRFAQGVEQTFPDFARWAAKRHTAYGLGRTPAQVRATYFETAEKLDHNPVLGVDGALFRQVVFGGLYSPLDEVSPLSNALSVFIASTCNDSEWPEDVKSYRRAVAEDREKFPMFGAASANILPCAYWSEPVEPPVQISDEGPHNVLARCPGVTSPARRADGSGHAGARGPPGSRAPAAVGTGTALV